MKLRFIISLSIIAVSANATAHEGHNYRILNEKTTLSSGTIGGFTHDTVKKKPSSLQESEQMFRMSAEK